MSGISAASLVDLKAELFRKQEEFKKQKLSNSSTNYIKGKTTEKFQKTPIFGRKNAGVAARAQKDLVAKTEEENLHEKSRRTLEAKSKLYEKITQDSGIPNEDGSQRFLVDFEKKAIDKQQEQNKKKEEEEKEKNDYSEDEFVDSPSNPEEKWVEYTDSLGRTRTCMKKDLETMQKKDKQLGILPSSQNKDEEKITESPVGSNSNTSSTMLTSQEIYCQMLKEKWNKEEEEAQTKPAGPVHYENVRFDEIRTHGVGYFQFSKDETARQEQMDLLNSLRDQTKEERSKRNLLKEKRDNLKAERLKKIKDRQRAKMGLPPEPEIEEEELPDQKITENILREVKPEVVAKTPAPIREWDLGKDKIWDLDEKEKKYFKERREERERDFAPPSFYYSSNEGQARKRKIYQERQYSPPPEKKLVPQKLKKDKIKQKQQVKKEIVKEKEMENCTIIPDLSTIPLPGETIPCNDREQNEVSTSSNNSYVTEYQQTQPSGVTIPAANIVPPQMWSQSMTTTPTPINNAMFAPPSTAAFNNQQQNIYNTNVASSTEYHFTQASSSVNVVSQETVKPEKPKPIMIDKRFVRNVELLQDL